MGIVRTIRGEDGRPYISLEDLIKEVEEARKYEDSSIDATENSNFIDIVLKTLKSMEIEYYDKYLFRKK
jgi:hypothetical protein